MGLFGAKEKPAAEGTAGEKVTFETQLRDSMLTALRSRDEGQVQEAIRTLAHQKVLKGNDLAVVLDAAMDIILREPRLIPEFEMVLSNKHISPEAAAPLFTRVWTEISSRPPGHESAQEVAIFLEALKRRAHKSILGREKIDPAITYSLLVSIGDYIISKGLEGLLDNYAACIKEASIPEKQKPGLVRRVFIALRPT